MKARRVSIINSMSLLLAGSLFVVGICWSFLTNNDLAKGIQPATVSKIIAPHAEQIQNKTLPSREVAGRTRAFYANEAQWLQEELSERAQHPIFADEKIAVASEALRHGRASQKMDAIELLVKLAPDEATKRLRAFAADAKSDRRSSELLAEGLFHFSGYNDEALLDADLKVFYEQGDKETQQVSARMLSLRGDHSLAKSYLKTAAVGINDQDSKKRIETFYEIASVGTFDGVPYFVEGLKDKDPNVRVVALSLLNTYGSNVHVPAVELLRSDDNPRVRALAELVVADLWKKSSPGIYSTAHHALPPDAFDEESAEINPLTHLESNAATAAYAEANNDY